MISSQNLERFQQKFQDFTEPKQKWFGNNAPQTAIDMKIEKSNDINSTGKRYFTKSHKISRQPNRFLQVINLKFKERKKKVPVHQNRLFQGRSFRSESQRLVSAWEGSTTGAEAAMGPSTSRQAKV